MCIHDSKTFLTKSYHFPYCNDETLITVLGDFSVPDKNKRVAKNRYRKNKNRNTYRCPRDC
jgi:hypothetical protein